MAYRWVTAGLILVTLGADLAVLKDRDDPAPIAVSGSSRAAIYTGDTPEFGRAARDVAQPGMLVDAGARWLVATVKWKAALRPGCVLDLRMDHPRGWTWEGSTGALPAATGSDARTFVLTAEPTASSAKVLFRVPLQGSATVTALSTALVARCQDGGQGQARLATAGERIARIPKPLPDPGELHERGEIHVLNVKGLGPKVLQIPGISPQSAHVIIRWVCDGPSRFEILNAETGAPIASSTCTQPDIDLADVATTPLPSKYEIKTTTDTYWRIAFSVRN